MSVLITICCRSGSKGLPGKHMKMFNMRPLISWTIEQAIGSCIGEVVISTDDKELMGFCSMYDVTILARDPSLSKDDTPKLDVLRDAVDFYNNLFCDLTGKERCDTLIDLDATNPCRTVEHIKEALELFRESNADVVFSVTPAKKNPFFNQVELDNGMFLESDNHPGVPSMIFGNEGMQPTSRQDADEVFDMNSSIYIYRVGWLEDKRNLHPVCFNSRAYVMPPWTFCDIDDEKDFYAAEALHKRYCLEAPTT